jgi:hypothetical protein
MTAPAIWTQAKPYRVTSSIATGDRLTRFISNVELFATEAEAMAAFGLPRARFEKRRDVDMMIWLDKPDRYGSKTQLVPIAHFDFYKAAERAKRQADAVANPKFRARA